MSSTRFLHHLLASTLPAVLVGSVLAAGCGSSTNPTVSIGSPSATSTATATKTASATSTTTRTATATATGEEPTETATAEPTETSTAVAEDNGDVKLFYDDIADPDLSALEERVKGVALFENEVAAMNEYLALPQDLEIHFTTCGEINAFYSPDTKMVSMCMELVQYFLQQFEGVLNDKDLAFSDTMDSTLFVMNHESGHALVDYFGLPITGKEEDAVDDLASVVLLRAWDRGNIAVRHAALSFYLTGQDQVQMKDIPYWDEHSLGLQRYYSILCLVYGQNPDLNADLVPKFLPLDRAVRCDAEWQQKSRSWQTLLMPHLKKDLPE